MDGNIFHVDLKNKRVSQTKSGEKEHFRLREQSVWRL